MQLNITEQLNWPKFYKRRNLIHANFRRNNSIYTWFIALKICMSLLEGDLVIHTHCVCVCVCVDTHLYTYVGLPGCLNGTESTCNAGDLGSIPGSRRSPGKENGYPLQYSCLENSMDRGAWQATVHGVAKSQTRLNDSHLYIHTYT